MAAGEVRIAVPANKKGVIDEKGAGTLYVVMKGGRLTYDGRTELATIYPNETWARKDMARSGVPAFARVEAVTE